MSGSCHYTMYVVQVIRHSFWQQLTQSLSTYAATPHGACTGDGHIKLSISTPAALNRHRRPPARQGPGMQAETETGPVQGASHPHLRQGVAPADPRHHARPGGCINDVWHDRPSVSAMAIGELAWAFSLVGPLLREQNSLA